MKRTFILSTVTSLLAVFIFASCQPSRVYANKDRDRDRDQEERYPEDRYDRYPEERYERYPPPPPARYYNASLIISPRPGFVMNRGADGRFYHRSPQGLLYWKGYDNRFYLDRSYINRVQYDRWEYDEWKRYSPGNSRGVRRY